MPLPPALHRQYQKNLYHTRRTAGLCGQCGNPSKRFHKCSFCRDMIMENRRKHPMTSIQLVKEADRSRRVRAERKSLGLCQSCGLASDGRKFCEVCRDRSNTNRRALCAERKAA